MTITQLIPQLKTVRHEDDPLRAALKDALEAAAEARQCVENQRAGIQTARAGVFAAKRKLDAAKTAASSAVEDHAARIAEAAASGSPVPPATMRAARDAEQDAADEVQAMEAAVVRLKAHLPGLQESARDAEVEVDSAISAVFLVPARALFDRACALERELEPLRQALATLLKDRMPEAGDALAHQRGRAPLNPVYSEIMKFGGWRAGGPDLFAVARAALRSNPDAELPSDFAPPPPT